MAPRSRYLAAFAIVAIVSSGGVCAAESLLPDLFAWENTSLPSLHGGVFELGSISGRSLFRFHVAIANIGDGPLEVREQTQADQTQDVFQRVYDTNGSVEERIVGSFPDANPAFGHLFFVGLAQYNLRQVLPGGGVGPIVSSHNKTSFGLVDGEEFDLSLPGAPAAPIYESAQDEFLGISVGWADLYRRHLPGQWVDATGLQDGQYWLEVVIDPFDRVLELDNTNNTTRVLVDLIVPGSAEGDYNNDGSVDAADYTLWRDLLDQNEPGLAADGNRDGIISMADYEAWKSNFGAGNGTGELQSIPEPGTLIFVLIVCIGGWPALPNLAGMRSSYVYQIGYGG